MEDKYCTDNDNYRYVGSELELFATAINWKRYYRDLIGEYISGPDVLEVGAGLGEMTKLLAKKNEFVDWTCLEPDRAMCETIQQKIDEGILPTNCSVRHGVVSDLEVNKTYDTVIYIDVLEHISNDRLEVEVVEKHLNPMGRFVIIVPAHNWLLSPWDKAIGHFRRYNRNMMSRLRLENLHDVRNRYFDSVGLVASLANKLILKQADPTTAQIIFWDRVLLRMSRVFDRMLFYSFGKNLVVVWEKDQ